MHSRNGFARVLTLLLLFFVTIVAVLLVFSLFTGILRVGPQGSTDMVSVTGNFAATTVGGSTGTLTMNLQNLGPSSATGITIECPVAYFTSSACGGLVMLSNGIPVSAQHPVSKGQTASGASTVQAAPGIFFTPGKVFAFTYVVVFSDGTSLSQTIQLATQP